MSAEAVTAPLRPVIALTTGEPAGIGPDIALRLAAEPRLRRGGRVVLVGDAGMLARRARRLGLAVRLTPFDGSGPRDSVSVAHVPLAARETPGRLEPANASYVLATIDRALEGCLAGRFAAMVTAPVHKAVINEAGIAFTGHTEYLAEHTGTARVVMMLVGGRPVLRVALATTHLALKDVPAAIDGAMLEQTLTILESDLRSRFALRRPRIAVAGLNPHAGESGHMGREEIEVIAPVIERMRGRGMRLSGPLPADTLFTPRVLEGFDAVLAMYHDQGLPVLKHASFGAGVNVTLGLPVIRTSVDHGTALDLAARLSTTRAADVGSLAEAFSLARDLALARRRPPGAPAPRSR